MRSMSTSAAGADRGLDGAVVGACHGAGLDSALESAAACSRDRRNESESRDGGGGRDGRDGGGGLMANPIAPAPASGAGASQDQQGQGQKTQAQPAPKKEQKGQGQQDVGQGERQRRADGTFAPAPGPSTSAATAADTTQGSGILGGPIKMGGLPGVMDDGETGEREELAKAGAADGLGAAPGPQGEPPAAATPAPAARPIKPIPDKITAAAATTQAQAAQPQHRVEGDETGQPEPAEPTEKFILAGEEFESREQAEQNIRVLRGHYKKYKEQADAGARAVQQFEQLRPEYDRIVQYAQELEQRLRQSPSPVQPQPQPANANLPASGPQRQPATPVSSVSPGGQPSAGAPSGPLTAEGLLDSAVDWKMIGTAAQQHGPVVATYLALEGVVGKLLDHFNADVDRRLNDRVAPLQHTHDALQVTSTVSNLWSQMRDMVYTDGSPAYPEFDDPAAATQIGRIWMSLRIPIEEKMTVRGAHMAIALYRDQMSRAGAAGTASGNGAGQVNGNGSNSLPTTAELIAQLGPVGAIAREIVQDVVGGPRRQWRYNLWNRRSQAGPLAR